MLMGTGFESGGRMATMGKLLSAGSHLDTSTEIARERAAMLAVQREMCDADEANLLEEEDMHVFDQEPLTDRFSLVSCNTCKKPIKVSQYAAHAERCRLLMMSDENGMDEGLRRHPRRLRNGLVGDPDVSLSDEAADSGVSNSDTQVTLRTGKRTLNGAEAGTGPKVGRPRKLSVHNHKDLTDGLGEDGIAAGPSTTVQEGLSSSGKRRKQYLPFTVEDLDVMCGVPSPRSGAPCRQPLTCKSHSLSSKRAVAGRRKPFDALLQEMKENITKKAQQADIPRPLATKIYCSNHNQRMRSVISTLYRESLAHEGRPSLTQSEQLQLEANQQQLQLQQQQQQHHQQHQHHQQQMMLMTLNKGLQ